MASYFFLKKDIWELAFKISFICALKPCPRIIKQKEIFGTRKMQFEIIGTD